MSFLNNPHLDLTASSIETKRCVIVPFSFDRGVDIHEFQIEFCRANTDFFVSPTLTTYEEEVEFLKGSIEKIQKGEEFENFILEKGTNRLLGAGGLRILASGELNIGIWIRVDEHGKGYASEVYEALIAWARENTSYIHLKHSLNPENIGSRRLVEKFGGILQKEQTKSGHDIYHIPLR